MWNNFTIFSYFSCLKKQRFLSTVSNRMVICSKNKTHGTHSLRTQMIWSYICVLKRPTAKLYCRFGWLLILWSFALKTLKMSVTHSTEHHRFHVKIWNHSNWARCCKTFVEFKLCIFNIHTYNQQYAWNKIIQINEYKRKRKKKSGTIANNAMPECC